MFGTEIANDSKNLRLLAPVSLYGAGTNGSFFQNI